MAQSSAARRSGQPPAFNYINWVLPGVLVFNALAFGLITSSSMMLTMRELGVLRRLQATPMPAGQLVGAYFLVNVTIVLLQSLLIIALWPWCCSTPRSPPWLSRPCP